MKIKLTVRKNVCLIYKSWYEGIQKILHPILLSKQIFILESQAYKENLRSSHVVRKQLEIRAFLSSTR